MSTDAEFARRSVPALPVVIVYGSALLQGSTLVAVPALSSTLKQTLGLSDALYGALFLPQVTAAVVGAIAGSALARRLGLARLLVFGLLANATSALLIAVSGQAVAGAEWLLPAATASLGLGFGLMGGPLNTYPGLLFPLRHRAALVAAHTLIGLGLAIGPLVAAVFIAAGAWTGFPLLLAATASAAAVAAAAVDLPSTPAGMRPRKSLLGPTASPRFWLFAIVTVLYAFAEGTFSSWAVIFLRDVRGVSEASAGWALSGFWGALVLGRSVAAFAVSRVPAHRLWLALPVLMIAAFWLVPFSSGAATGVAIFALAGLSCSAFLPLTIGLATEQFRDETAAVSSLLIAALMVGVGLGSFLIGALQAMMPLETLYRASSVYPMLALALAGIAVRIGPAASR